MVERISPTPPISVPPPTPKGSTSIPSVRREAWRAARVLLIHDDSGSADALAQEIRARGGVVVVSGRSEHGVLRARELDPEIVVLDSGSVVGPALDIVQVMERDTRLRWASRVVVRWDDVWPAGASMAHMDRLAERVLPIRNQEESVLDRSEAEAQFSVPLAPLGPCRLLRALATSSHVLEITTTNGDRRVLVDLADGLLAGASIFLGDTPVLEGLEALAVWMDEEHGDVEIVRKRAPHAANVLLPVEVALATASREHGADVAAQRLGDEQKTRNAPLPEGTPSTPPRAPVFDLDPYGASTRRMDVDIGGIDIEQARAIVDGVPKTPPVPTTWRPGDAPTPSVPAAPVARSAPWLAIAIAAALIALGGLALKVVLPAAPQPLPPTYVPPTGPTSASQAPTPAVETPRAEEPSSPPEPRATTRQTLPPSAPPATVTRTNSTSNDTHAMYDEARAAMREARYDDAIRLAERLVALRRRRVEYRWLLGDAYKAAGRASDAQAAYSEARALDR
jgi:hypothetical protein